MTKDKIIRVEEIWEMIIKRNQLNYFLLFFGVAHAM